MVQIFIQMLRGYAAGLIWPLLLLIFVVVLVLLLLLLFSAVGRERFEAVMSRIPGNVNTLYWALPLALLLVCTSGLDLTGNLVAHRISADASARTVNQADPNAAVTVQSGPSVSYETTQTYTRSLIIPPALVKQVGEQGVGVLAPYLQDPTADNIVKLVDQFRRSGQDVVFTRQATLVSQVPIRLDASRIKVGLNFTQSAGHTFFNADFAATYSFTNPLKTPITADFTFPLPEGSGTLVNFSITVNNQELTAGELASNPQWQGVVAPGGVVTAHVVYRHQGAKGWTYALAGRRDPIRNFDLTLTTNQPAKFNRYSLFPTSISSSLGGIQTLRWNLPNALTAQDVAVVFSGASNRETAAKFYGFAPLALLLATLLGLAWAVTRNLRPTVGRVSLALLGVSAGLLLGGVLMSYLPLPVAGILGALLAAGLGLGALGWDFWPALLVAAISPLAFLSSGNAGLILGLLALLAVALLIFAPGKKLRPPPRPADGL